MADIDRSTELVLTPSGRKKVESLRGEGTEFALLSLLYNSGGMSVGELQQGLRIPDYNKVVGYSKVLVRRGYVQPVTTSEYTPA